MPKLSELPARAGEVVLAAVDMAVEGRWEPTLRNAAATRGSVSTNQKGNGSGSPHAAV